MEGKFSDNERESGNDVPFDLSLEDFSSASSGDYAPNFDELEFSDRDDNDVLVQVGARPSTYFDDDSKIWSSSIPLCTIPVSGALLETTEAW